MQKNKDYHFEGISLSFIAFLLVFILFFCIQASSQNNIKSETNISSVDSILIKVDKYRLNESIYSMFKGPYLYSYIDSVLYFQDDYKDSIIKKIQINDKKCIEISIKEFIQDDYDFHGLFLYNKSVYLYTYNPIHMPKKVLSIYSMDNNNRFVKQFELHGYNANDSPSFDYCLYFDKDSCIFFDFFNSHESIITSGKQKVITNKVLSFNDVDYSWSVFDEIICFYNKENDIISRISYQRTETSMKPLVFELNSIFYVIVVDKNKLKISNSLNQNTEIKFSQNISVIPYIFEKGIYVINDNWLYVLSIL